MVAEISSSEIDCLSMLSIIADYITLLAGTCKNAYFVCFGVFLVSNDGDNEHET